MFSSKQEEFIKNFCAKLGAVGHLNKLILILMNTFASIFKKIIFSRLQRLFCFSQALVILNEYKIKALVI